MLTPAAEQLSATEQNGTASASAAAKQSPIEFTVQTGAIAEELPLLLGAIGKDSSLPILSNLLIETGAGELKITASSLDLTVQTRLPAEVKTPGKITVPAKKFAEIVRTLGETPLTIRSRDSLRLELFAESAEFELSGITAVDYPEMPSASTQESIALPTGPLLTAIRKTGFSVSTDNFRYALNGALLQLDNRKLLMTGTDGHRLAHYAAELEETLTQEESKAILSLDTLHLLEKFLSQTEEARVSFARIGSHLIFSVGNRNIISRVIEADFPDYSRFLGMQNPHTAKFAKADLRKAITRVAAVSSEKTRAIAFEFQNQEVTRITSKDNGSSRGSDRVAGEYAGATVRIGFNSDYLRDFLSAEDSDRILIKLNNDKAAAILSGEGNTAGASYTYILMPMKLD